MVYCSKEFVSRLIYVAISRVRHPDDLQVCRFKCDQLLKPSDEGLRVCENSQAQCSDLSCCVNWDLTSDFFKVSDLGAEFGEGDGDASEILLVDSYSDGLVSSYFEREDDNKFVDLGAVFLNLDEGENELSQSPDDFDICKVLQNQTVPEPMQSNNFCTAKNAAISKVLTDSAPHRTKI